jgi:hypothetical protein
VLGGLGENEGEGGGYGGDGGYGGGMDGSEGSIGETAAEAAFGAATEAAANAMAQAEAAANSAASANASAAFAQQQSDYEAASVAASNAAAFAQQQADYEAVSLAAANAATFAAAQMADEAAMAAAAKALASNSAAKQAAQKALTIASMFPGPVGMIAGIAKAIASLVDGVPKSQAEIDQTFENARGGAQGNVEVLKQISILKTNSDAASKAGSEAAVARLYQTYANRNPNSVELAYWSNAFGPTITADEVLQFQQFLYANEPNLRPVAMTTTTTSTSPGAGLALPIIAAIAGYFILGS